MSRLVAHHDEQFLPLNAPGCEGQPNRRGVPDRSEVGGDCSRATTGARQGSQTLADAIFARHLLVRFYPDDEWNVLFMQENQPIKANEFTIGQKALDAFGPEQTQIALHQRNALFGVAVARLAQNLPGQRHTITARGNGKNQKVDLFAPDLPVRAIKAQVPTPGEPEHTHNKRADQSCPRRTC